MTCDGVILCGDIDSEFSLSFTEGNISVNKLYIKFIKKKKKSCCIIEPRGSPCTSIHFIWQHYMTGVQDWTDCYSVIKNIRDRKQRVFYV